MVKILPAILEQTKEGIKEKLGRLEGICQYAQIDVADGIFVESKTFSGLDAISKLTSSIKLDFHLMVERPEQWIAKCKQKSVFRITFHYESTYDVRRTMQMIKSIKKEVGIAIKIETPVSVLAQFRNEIDFALLMSVNAGFGGQKFNESVLEKIRELKSLDADLAIGVDGGITPIVAPALVQAGADVLISGSYLFEQKNIKEAIKTFQS